jgi:hypothetical protein
MPIVMLVDGGEEWGEGYCVEDMVGKRVGWEGYSRGEVG